jgi:ATP synthase protein I
MTAVPPTDDSDFAEQVGAKADRTLAARRRPPQSVWLGLGMVGMVGWSVTVPTLAGAALGVWLDAHHPGKHSWTLALMIAGLAVGCWNAWRWIAAEDHAMRDEQQDA